MNVDRIPTPFFIDTNVFVYSFDAGDKTRREKAHSVILHALGSQRGIISSQVVQEFLIVALRRFAKPMTVFEGLEYLRAVLMPLCRHYPHPGFYDRALLIRQESGSSFYDSLVLAAAIETRCAALLSEDMQTGRTIQGLTIIDPFIEDV
jgi:predicted nucleic acid-binding protein